MFETLEVGNRLKKSEFNKRELTLRQELLKAQFELRDSGQPVLIVVAGLDGAGKGSLVHRLNEWMDPRGIETNTLWKHSDEEESRPYFWRFWRRLPARGSIGIFLGSWYTNIAQDTLDKKVSRKEFASGCEEIEAFERTQTDDGALIIKIWLHITKETQRLQLEGKAPRKQQNPRTSDHPYELRGMYKETLKVSEKLIKATDSSHSPWCLIESEDKNYRDISAGEIILEAMQEHIRRASNESAKAASDAVESDLETPKLLDGVDLSLSLEKDEYKRLLIKYQAKLQDLAWEAYRQDRSVVAVFEGWDAAGKGSSIRRVTAAMDPRLYSLQQFAAPTDEESAHHYLWRFWRKLQRDGLATFFDRSWYGRVMVERVEGFATEHEWRRAYTEINQFEKQLTDHGCIVLKFWIHIGKDEQEKRFHLREIEPYKQHKLTAEDWRNREKWDEYEEAVNQMISMTSTAYAPWTLVSGNDKPYARVQILKTFCKQIKKALAD